MQSYYKNIAKLTEDSNKIKKKITLKSLSDDVQDLKNIMQETLSKIGNALSMEDEKGAGISKDKNLTVKGSNARRLSKIIAGDRNKKKKKTSLSSLGSDVRDLNKIGNALSMENEKDAGKLNLRKVVSANLILWLTLENAVCLGSIGSLVCSPFHQISHKKAERRQASFPFLLLGA